MKKKKSKNFRKLHQDDIITAFSAEEKAETVAEKNDEPEQAAKTVKKIAATHTELEIGKFSGIDRSSAEKLKRGKFLVEATLDLHGYKLDEAYFSFRNFIDSSFRQGRKCVLIITGKGKKSEGGVGVIKSNINDWINQPEMRSKIIVVSRAAIKDGGEGAVYILLKKNKKN